MKGRKEKRGTTWKRAEEDGLRLGPRPPNKRLAPW